MAARRWFTAANTQGVAYPADLTILNRACVLLLFTLARRGRPQILDRRELTAIRGQYRQGMSAQQAHDAAVDYLEQHSPGWNLQG